MSVNNPIRVGIQAELFARTGALLNLVFVESVREGVAPLSVEPSSVNSIYNGAIGFALNLCCINAANPSLIADTDFEKFNYDLYYEMLDLAEYRLILNCLGNFPQPDESLADRSQSWNGLANRFQARATALEALYKAKLKTSRYTIGFRTIRLPIAPQPNPLYDVYGFGI